MSLAVLGSLSKLSLRIWISGIAAEEVLSAFLTGHTALGLDVVGGTLLDLAAKHLCRQQSTHSKIASKAPAKTPNTMPALQ